MVWNIWDFVCSKEQGRLRDRRSYSSFIMSFINFTPSLKPLMNTSRSEIEEMSVTDSMSLSNSSFCSKNQKTTSAETPA